MAFESLSEKLQQTFKKLRGRGKVSTKDVKEAMREIKLVLLEADVNFKVVKDFIKSVSEQAEGAQVLESLTPATQIIKIVRDQLTLIMGQAHVKINISSKPPTVIMLVGLQGAGKTTTCGKLARYLKKMGKRPMLVACDIYRPAAIKQLQVVASSANVPFYSEENNQNPVEIAQNAIALHRDKNSDVVIIDTAGRLHINEQLMTELSDIKSSVNPHEILLVVDSMSGQDCVNVATSFNEQLGIDGVILTKFDGDARGGAALSVRSVTQKPIKFCGIGEKLDDLEPFHPDRLAQRLLGMGDVLTLIDKAQQNFDEKQAIELERKIREESFDLNDFLAQLEQMKNMGPLSHLAAMIPGVNKQILDNADLDGDHFTHIEAIIKSMTKKERQQPHLINSSRKKRIAAGSGTKIQQVNQLLKQFDQLTKMMKQLKNPKQLKKLKKLKGNKFL